MAHPTTIQVLYPELLWWQGQFVAGHGVLFSELGILKVAPGEDLQQDVEQAKNEGRYITARHLSSRALLPGFVNTHSHAFQRAIRGRTEYPAEAQGRSEDFWSWRALMYQAARELEPVDIEAISQAVFVEMVKSGITRVGEFHYLHHQADGTPYPNPDELTHRVLSAARSAGLHLTVLRSFYQRAGVGRPHPEGSQKIFCDPSLEYYLESLERLREEGHSVGVTAHSMRAVDKESLARVIEYAKDKDLPFHIHASEQQKEVEECLQEYGCRPVELLEDLGALTPKTSLVHAIHLNEREIEAIGKASCSICSCPTTERNLGDGVVPARELLEAGAHFTFGTDSQCQISLLEDARQLEYHLRLQAQKRSILFSNQETAGRTFLDMLSLNGARSLGIEKAGKIDVGYASDLVAIDLEHLSLAGSSPQSLALDLIFSATPSLIKEVWVNGTEVVTEGHHRAEKQASANLKRVMGKLRASTKTGRA